VRRLVSVGQPPSARAGKVPRRRYGDPDDGNGSGLASQLFQKSARVEQLAA
jgi:hypothetical protein